MVKTDTPSARDELERLAHEYRHLRDERRRARRGSSVRRRLGARLHELETRFEHLLALLPADDETRRGWRDHLHERGTAPELPADETQLVLEQGASVRVPAPTGGSSSIHVRDVPAQARDDLERTLARVVDLSPRPVLHARASLERLPDPALERPVLAKAQLDLGVRRVRAHTAATGPVEAIDQLEARLRRSLRDLADREASERRAGAPAPRPSFRERAPEERQLVRRKSFASGAMAPEEAAWEMGLLDHDFHVFPDAESGEDALVYIHSDGTLGLKRVGGGGGWVEPFLLDPEPAPELSPDEAAERLTTTGEGFLFFVLRETGRGAALYRRYDGDLGLVMLRGDVPGALQLKCAQCGHVLPDDAAEVARWRHGYLALAGEIDEVSAGMLLCPDCAAEAVGERIETGGGD